LPGELREGVNAGVFN